MLLFPGFDRGVFFDLTNSFGAMGEEGGATGVARSELEKFADCVYEDGNGNIVGVIGNRDAKFNILLDAHLDQVCLIVTHICEGGFLKFASCGGIDSRILPGKLVKIISKGKDVFGIICTSPPHISKGETDYSKKEELLIDTGLNEDEIKNLIPLGSRATFASCAKPLLNESIVSKSIDNRAGVMVLLHFAKIFSKRKLRNAKISILLSNGEEINAAGAKTGTFALKPDLAIAVDVSFATQPKVDGVSKGEMGKGPMIGVSPCLCSNIYKKIIKLAQDNNIPFQIEVMPERTGTNSDHIVTSRSGVEVGLLSIPIRYMHTMSETVCLKDIDYTCELLEKYVSTILSSVTI